jgi:hypothetical protein
MPCSYRTQQSDNSNIIGDKLPPMRIILKLLELYLVAGSNGQNVYFSKMCELLEKSKISLKHDRLFMHYLYTYMYYRGRLLPHH